MRHENLLTETEARFVRALACGEPPTTAIRSAGQSIGMAAHVLRRKHVAASVRDLHARLSKVVAKLDQPTHTRKGA